MDHFLKDAEENFVSAIVVGPRKLEVGLLVPTELTGVAKKLKFATVLLRILKRKNK